MKFNCNFYEIERLRQMSIFESMLKEKGYQQIAGVDEAGRGPLAGPLVVAACILPDLFFLEGINDSKQLTNEKRQSLYKDLTNNHLVNHSIVVIEENTIDQLNILQATMFGMSKAINHLKIKPDYVLIDGNRMPATQIKGEAIVSGDSYSVSIAAASILAKVKRDEIMIEMHKKYPQYSFHEHKGYATKLHLSEIEKYGPCPIHRKSFEPIKSMNMNQQLSLPLE